MLDKLQSFCIWDRVYYRYDYFVFVNDCFFAKCCEPYYHIQIHGHAQSRSWLVNHNYNDNHVICCYFYALGVRTLAHLYLDTWYSINILALLTKKQLTSQLNKKGSLIPTNYSLKMRHIEYLVSLEVVALSRASDFIHPSTNHLC
jgi:hypothetical protein